MDEYSGKRAVGGIAIPRKRSGLVLRDAVDNRDQNAQFCNRLGCNGRLNYGKGTQIECSEKAKSSRSCIHSSSDKEIIEGSSRGSSMVTSTRKSFQEFHRKRFSQLQPDSSETSTVQDEPEVSELIPSSEKVQTGFQCRLKDAESGKVGMTEVGSSSIASESRSQKTFQQKSRLADLDTQLGSSVPLASKRTFYGARNGASASRYGLKNLKCNSVSDVLPSGSSSSDPKLSRRKDMVKKRNPEGETSYSDRGKKMSGSSSGLVSMSTNGITFSDSRRARNFPSSRDNGVASVRTRRSIDGNNRMMLSNQGNENNASLTRSPVGMPQMPQPEIAIGSNDASSSHQFSAEASSSYSNSYNRPSAGGSNVPSMMPIDVGEHGITLSSMNHDSLRRYNMDGITEVLLALERIEQDEELTYEQLLTLETNLLLGSLSFYDQHRDMRLDIDNMSYEL
ncbi:uncharacterized protein LOC132283980 isoform X2 [Cornus florida]|uniref:uncharacterized protein LOC132283980 isoform X2 n=1 Tax=Cornus florida TaxID=4283 RepID=UPI0028A292B8|nr:uncharacterized protein LOC132283980 isoform X2 [Cornus florida]